MLVEKVWESTDLLVCPKTKQKLHLCTLAEAETKIGGRLSPGRRSSGPESAAPKPVGATSRVLLREDCRCSYPVVDEIPVLMMPEILLAEGERREIDLRDPRYAETYTDMEHYNDVAAQEVQNITSSETYAVFAPVLKSDMD